MPRINIDDLWFVDPRRDFLFKKGIDADGVMLRLWRVAQQYWTRTQQGIPKPIFLKFEHSKIIIEAGLAEENDEFFYIKGSKQSFNWLVQNMYNGQKGGCSNAAALSRNHEDFFEANRSERKRIEAYSSSSYSSSKKNIRSFDENNQETMLESFAQPSVARVSFDFEQAYKIYPRKVGKTRGFKKLKTEIKSEKDFQDLLAAVKSYTKFVEKDEKTFIKHFSTFTSEWRDWIPEISAPKKVPDKNCTECSGYGMTSFVDNKGSVFSKKCSCLMEVTA